MPVSPREFEDLVRRTESEAIRRVASGESLEETLAAVAEMACEALDADGLAICLYDAAAERVRPAAASGLSAELVAELDACLTRACAYGLRTLAIGSERHPLATIGRDSGMPKTLQEIARRDGLRAFASEPIVARSGRPIGSISIFREGTGAHDDSGVATTRIARMIGVAVELDRTDRTAQESDAQLSALLDAAVNGVVVIDESGAIEVFNKAAERIFGYSAAEIAGRNVSELMPTPYREHHDAYIATYLETRKPKIIGIGREVEARRKDGTVFPAELSVGEAAPIAGGHRFVGIIRDITERRRLEEEARQDRERLAHVTRLTMMGEMATGIAHEINQPLTAIASYAQACIRLIGDEEARHDDDIQDALEQISRQAMRAGEVIRRLRTFVRKGENKRTPGDLNALVSEVERLAEVDAKLHGAKLRLELAESLPRVLADGVQVQQVLLNLIRNALEAMEEAGVTDEPVIVRTARDGDEIEVAVIDSGVGLKPEEEDSLFNPFHTTKKTGMGMGLSISRSIIMSHGGRMWFTRNEERGTTFHFSLPIMRRDEDDDGGVDG